MLNFYFEALSVECSENDADKWSDKWLTDTLVDAAFEATKKEWLVNSPFLEISLQILEMISQVYPESVFRPMPDFKMSHIKKIAELACAGNLNRACVYLIKEILNNVVLSVKSESSIHKIFVMTDFFKNFAKLVDVRKRSKTENRTNFETEINWKERAYSIECIVGVLTDLFDCDFFRPETITINYKNEFDKICESFKNEQYQNCEGTSYQKLYDTLKKFKSQHDRHWPQNISVFQDYFITMSTPVKRRRSESK